MGPFNLEFNLDKKSPYLVLDKTIDQRYTIAIRRYIFKLAENYKKQISGRYKKIKDPEATLISKNLHAVLARESKEAQKEIRGKGDVKENVVNDIHMAATVVKAVKIRGDQIDTSQTVIKIVPNKRKFKQSPLSVYLLSRFGPWTLETIPIIPKKNEATMLFVKVRKAEVEKTRNKNKRDFKKIKSMLIKKNISLPKKKIIPKDIEAISELEYWALRKELGIDARKVKIWGPALEYMKKRGLKDTFLKDKLLIKTLTDPNFTSYKSILNGVKMVSGKDLSKLEKFQKRIMR